MTKLPNLEGFKIQIVRTALLGLMIYMLDRAITALVYPADSQIIENAEQSAFTILQLFQLENVTHFVSNSVLFPLLLVILFRLSDFNIGKWIAWTLGLHYASVIVVSLSFAYFANIEYTEYVNSQTFYADDQGGVYTEEQISNGFAPYDMEDIVGETPLLNETEHRFSIEEFLYYFYSMIMALILLVLGALSLPVLNRMNFNLKHKPEAQTENVPDAQS